MANLDDLQIKITADASSASRQLGRLSANLSTLSTALSSLNAGKLTSLANGVSQLATSMTAFTSATKTADFSRLSSNLEKLNNANVGNLTALSSGLVRLSASMSQLNGATQVSQQLSALITAIGKLGGVAIQRATTNLPILTSELMKLISALSRAPAVSGNTLTLVTALSNLSGSSINAVQSTSRLPNIFSKIASESKRSAHHVKSFAQIIGSFYANYAFVLRGMSGIWKSIKSSMNYVEVLNYFDKAFSKVTKSAVSEFDKAGQDSGEAFASSFTNSAKKVTAQMSGFASDATGYLMPTGGKTLGIDPTKLMNYQATFVQMSDSMGVASSQANKLSEVLVKIGADLASVKNLEFEDVWNNMASGLVGMSRTLDKYGVNIRNANMQQKLFDLGITTNISKLNQNDKALLRTIILLDSTRYAWGDLSQTLDQPANQLRMLQSNFANLARTIGNIFLPVVAKLLPYINALVIALQRLANWIVKLLGFEGFDWGSGGGGGGVDFLSDIADEADEASNSMDKAGASAKKLKKSVLGFDELNQLSDKEDKSGSGLGGVGGGMLDGAFNDAVDEYLKAWDEAYKDIQNRAQELADKIIEAFKKGDYKAIGKYIGDALIKAMKSIPWTKIYNVFSKFGYNLAQFLNGLITPELFYEVGKTIANSLNTVLKGLWMFAYGLDWEQMGLAIAGGINGFFENFDFKLLAGTINKWAHGIFNMIKTALTNINWKAVWKGIKDFFSELDLGTVAIIIGALALKFAPAVFSAIGSEVARLIIQSIGAKIMEFAPAISTALGEGLGSVVLPITAIVAVIALLVAGLKNAYDSSEEIRQGFANATDSIKNALAPAFDYLTNTVIPDLKEGWRTLKEILKPLGDYLSGVFASVWEDMINPALSEIGENVLPLLVDTFKTLWSNVLVPFGNFLASVLKPVIETIASVLKILWKDVVVPLAQFIGNTFISAFKGVVTFFNQTLYPAINSMIERWQWVWDKALSPLVNKLKGEFLEKFKSVMDRIHEYIDNMKMKFEGIIEFITGVFTLNWEQAWEGLVKIFKAKLNNIANIFEGCINGIIDGFNKYTSTFRTAVNGLAEKAGIDISIGEIPHITLPRFATGGFPQENGLFMANSSEIVGKFSNGKTAVANNEQIVNGIKQGVYEAVAMAMSNNNSGNGQYINNTIQIDGETIARAVTRGQNSLSRRYSPVTT